MIFKQIKNPNIMGTLLNEDVLIKINELEEKINFENNIKIQELIL